MIDIEKLTDLIIDKAEDVKAKKLEVYDVSENSDIVDCFIICTGNSRVHINSIVGNVTKGLKEIGMEHSVDGRKGNMWIAIDTGPVIVHIMGEEERDRYKLEDIWRDSAVIYH